MSHAALRERYLRAQLAGNRREAMRLVLEEGLGGGHPVEEMQTQVVQAAQNEIGRLWQLNEVSIAQEHMATAISQLVLAALFERARAARSLDKKLVIACVEGELHDLPARMVADMLELEGFDVRYLGANVPHKDLVSIIEREQPDVIGLSVTMTFNVPSLRIAIERVQATTNAPVFIGGHATTWDPALADGLRVVVANTRADVLDVAYRLSGATRTP